MSLVLCESPPDPSGEKLFPGKLEEGACFRCGSVEYKDESERMGVKHNEIWREL